MALNLQLSNVAEKLSPEQKARATAIATGKPPVGPPKPALPQVTPPPTPPPSPLPPTYQPNFSGLNAFNASVASKKTAPAPQPKAPLGIDNVASKLPNYELTPEEKARATAIAKPQAQGMNFDVGTGLTPEQKARAQAVATGNQVTEAPGTKQGFTTTPNVKAEYKSPTQKAGELVQNLYQAPLRAIASATTGHEIQPKDRAGRTFLGDEPIKPIAQRVADNEQTLKDVGVKRGALPLAFGGVVASTALDLFLPGDEKKVSDEARDAIANTLKESLPEFQNMVNTREIGMNEFSKLADISTKIEKGTEMAKDLQFTHKALKDYGFDPLVTKAEKAGFETKTVVDKAMEKNPEAGFLSKPSIQDTKLGDALAPVKNLDPRTQEAFKIWNRQTLTAKELANSEVGKLAVPEKEGLQTILDYEAGKQTPHSEAIKAEFDKLFAEAKSRGLDVKYRENYIPQVYKDSPQEVMAAMSQYMKDKGVSPATVEAYVNGIQDLPKDVVAHVKLNPSFTKMRAFPDYKTAIEYGLTPKYTNPDQLLAYYRHDLEKTAANKEFIDTLVKQGQLKVAGDVPSGWKAIELPFSPKGYYAEPKLATMLNGLFRDESNLTFGQSLAKGIATTSKTMQEIALSAGIPKSNVNFFSMGQTIKEVTSGNLKAIPAFLRANFEGPSLKYFIDNKDTLVKMASQGIDLGGRIGQYGTVYKNMVEDKTIMEQLGNAWDKAFNEKTFGSFMPQLYTQTFKDAEAKALTQGMTAEEAQKFAGEVTKNAFGLVDNVGRSKTTQDVLSSAFFAPKFREGILNTLANAAASVTTEIRNPAFYKNRRFVVGAILSYGLYDALNKKLTGHHLQDNPSGHEFELMVTRPNGDVIYLPILPSFAALPRNLASGLIATGRGDFKTAGQKFGSVFSMPLKITAEVLTNKNYFGNAIYKDTDTGQDKLTKIAQYVGLQVNHPFIQELYNQLTHKKPLYQSISNALELPFKFSSLDKISQQQFYDALDKKAAEQAHAKKTFQPTYDKIRGLVTEGKTDEAKQLLNQLSDSDYKMYQNMKTAEKSADTKDTESKVYSTYLHVQELKNAGKVDEATAIVNGMSDADYKAYKLIKARFAP